MRRGVGLFIIIFGFGLLVQGQSSNYTKEQKNNFLDADSYYIYGDYRTAARIFKLIENADPNFAEVYYKIGYSFFELKKYKEAIPYLEKGIPYDFEAIYYLTEIYLRQEKMEEALENLELYESYWDDLISKHSEADVKRLKDKIETAQKMMKTPEKVKIINLGASINSEAHEYVPLIDGDESKLIFTTKRLSDINGYNADGLPFEDVYVSYREINGSWKNAVEVPGAINTESNDACVGLSADGAKMFVFKPNENLYAGDIYESSLKDEKWTTPILLDDHINNYTSTESSATVSLDGNVIYFSSNREGGYGGFDIYRVVKLPNGQWSWAKNLGPTINTVKDDDAPFLHPDGVSLYFSSQGHENMGGFDIFLSKKNDKEQWESPKNLGYPINTTSDDVHFVISANEQHGYYSSEKKSGFGGQDIYQIDYLEKELRQSIIRGFVKRQDKESLKSEISLINNSTGELEGIYKSKEEDGGFVFIVNPGVEYELIVNSIDGKEKNKLIKYGVKELKKPQELIIEIE
jgi:tetratricopeptide (TPR) repeat protein